MKYKLPLLIGGLFCLFSVIGGAFGAHLLKTTLNTDLLKAYTTAMHYLMFNGMALLLFVVIEKTFSIHLFLCQYSLLLGGILFSGSIVLLCFTTNPIFKNILGPITPIGGSLMVLSWMFLLIQITKKASE